MKLETEILATGLVHTVRDFVRREIGELESKTASASRLAEALSRIAVLEERLRVLEAERAPQKTARPVVKLAG